MLSALPLTRAVFFCGNQGALERPLLEKSIYTVHPHAVQIGRAKTIWRQERTLTQLNLPLLLRVKDSSST